MGSRTTNIVSIAAIAISLVSLGVTVANMRGTRSVDVQAHTVPAPAPSLAKPCLPLVSEGVNTFQPGEVESADFCVPGGEPIRSVQMSNMDAWAFSQPWEKTAQAIPDRLAFVRRQERPEETQVVIEAGRKQFLIVITTAQVKEKINGK